MTFAKTVIPGQSIPWSVVLQDYKTLDLPAPPNFIDLLNAQDVLSSVMDLRRTVLNKLNSVHYIFEFPEQFPRPLPVDLNRIANQCADALKILTDAASQAINSPLQAVVPKVDVPTDVLPQPLQGGAQEMVHVPSLNGMNVSAAQDFLAGLGLTSTVQLVEDPNPGNFLRVLNQDPPPGDVQKGKSIALTAGFHKILGKGPVGLEEGAR